MALYIFESEDGTRYVKQLKDDQEVKKVLEENPTHKLIPRK